MTIWIKARSLVCATKGDMMVLGELWLTTKLSNGAVAAPTLLCHHITYQMLDQIASKPSRQALQLGITRSFYFRQKQQQQQQ